MKSIYLATAFALSASAASAASLSVDDFSTFLVASTTDVAPVSLSVGDAGSGAIGDREFTAGKASGESGKLSSTESRPGTGLVLHTDDGSVASHSIKYGVVSPLNLDLTIFDKLVLGFAFLDTVPVFSAVTFIDGARNNQTEVLSADVTAPPAYDRVFNMSNFFGVDLSDIDMIEFDFAGLDGADVIINKISFEGPEMPQVPVPAALPLLLSGLGGFGLLRLRRRPAQGRMRAS